MHLFRLNFQNVQGILAQKTYNGYAIFHQPSDAKYGESGFSI